MRMKHPERICVHLPALMIEGANAIAAERETTFSEEVRRAVRRHVTAETRRLGITG